MQIPARAAAGLRPSEGTDEALLGHIGMRSYRAEGRRRNAAGRALAASAGAVSVGAILAGASRGPGSKAEGMRGMLAVLFLPSSRKIFEDQEVRHSGGIMPGIMFAFMWYMIQSEPATKIATIITVKTSAAMFQDWLEARFMCRK